MCLGQFDKVLRGGVWVCQWHGMEIGSKRGRLLRVGWYETRERVVRDDSIVEVDLVGLFADVIFCLLVDDG